MPHLKYCSSRLHGREQSGGWDGQAKKQFGEVPKIPPLLIFSAQSTNYLQTRALFSTATWPALSLPRSHFSSFWLVDKFTQACLSSSSPADRGTEANTRSSVFGLWSRDFPQYVDLARTHSSFWVKDKFTQHKNTSVIPTQLGEGQRQTLAWPFSKPQCLLRSSHQSWGKRCMISLFFVIFSANYVWRGIATKISIFSSIFLWVGFQVPHMGRPVPSCPGVQNLEDGEMYSILLILFVQSYQYLTWGVAFTG